LTAASDRRIRALDIRGENGMETEPETLDSIYSEYTHRLNTLPETDAALAEFGKDLTRDGENGVLTLDEQEALVTLFAQKLASVP